MSGGRTGGGRRQGKQFLILFWMGNDSQYNLDSIFRQKYKEERQAEEAEAREAEENQEQG